MSYLPLAHIFEFALENAALFWGTLLGYGTAKTLSDTSMKNCKGDIRELRPTLMVGVPAVWEQIRKGVVARVEQQNFIARNVFWAALAAKSWMLKWGLPGWALFDKTVFGKVREATGGRLRMTANGAGPISKDTLRFLSLVMAPMIGGYGMTETCGCVFPKISLLYNPVNTNPGWADLEVL
jgi:long-chain acyl-CoA synthetase